MRLDVGISTQGSLEDLDRKASLGSYQSGPDTASNHGHTSSITVRAVVYIIMCYKKKTRSNNSNKKETTAAGDMNIGSDI